MKTAISVPDLVFFQVEQCASELGISRSELYTRAADAFVQSRKTSAVTEQLNRVYDRENASEPDPILSELQARVLPRGKRRW
jgi:hypothetical protein